jgi:hypothetical protein
MLGNYFYNWILKYLYFIRTSEVEWPSAFTLIYKKLTQLSENTETSFPLLDVNMGSLWRERLMNATSGNAFQEIVKHITIGNVYRFDAATSIARQVLFRTSEGDLGYGPLSSRLGDQV